MPCILCDEERLRGDSHRTLRPLTIVALHPTKEPFVPTLASFLSHHPSWSRPQDHSLSYHGPKIILNVLLFFFPSAWMQGQPPRRWANGGVGKPSCCSVVAGKVEERVQPSTMLDVEPTSRVSQDVADDEPIQRARPTLQTSDIQNGSSVG